VDATLVLAAMHRAHKETIYSSGFQPGGRLQFFWGSRVLLVKIFINSSEFHLSYLEPLFAVTKTIGSPGKTDSLLHHLNCFKSDYEHYRVLSVIMTITMGVRRGGMQWRNEGGARGDICPGCSTLGAPN